MIGPGLWSIQFSGLRVHQAVVPAGAGTPQVHGHWILRVRELCPEGIQRQREKENGRRWSLWNPTCSFIVMKTLPNDIRLFDVKPTPRFHWRQLGHCGCERSAVFSKHSLEAVNHHKCSWFRFWETDRVSVHSRACVHVCVCAHTIKNIKNVKGCRDGMPKSS